MDGSRERSRERSRDESESKQRQAHLLNPCIRPCFFSLLPRHKIGSQMCEILGIDTYSCFTCPWVFFVLSFCLSLSLSPPPLARISVNHCFPMSFCLFLNVSVPSCNVSEIFNSLYTPFLSVSRFHCSLMFQFILLYPHIILSLFNWFWKWSTFCSLFLFVIPHCTVIFWFRKVVLQEPASLRRTATCHCGGGVLSQCLVLGGVKIKSPATVPQPQ